ncbi:MAG: hypothetical protein U0703_27900 [Anaerolineae bacterium]
MRAAAYRAGVEYALNRVGCAGSHSFLDRVTIVRSVRISIKTPARRIQANASAPLRLMLRSGNSRPSRILD